jgi:hypothetical protein
MNSWFFYAFKSILSHWMVNVGVLFFLALTLDLGTTGTNPLAIFHEAGMQEKIHFMLLLIIPLACFSSHFTLLRAWRNGGELALLSYLNCSPLRMLSPYICAFGLILSSWITLREISWPLLIAQHPELQKSDLRPIQLKNEAGEIYVFPLANHGEVVDILSYQKKQWNAAVRAYWYNDQWHAEKHPPDLEKFLVTHFFYSAPSPTLLFQQQQGLHSFGLLDLIQQKGPSMEIELAKRIGQWLWSILFFSAFWLYGLKNSQKLEKLTLWGILCFFGMPLIVEYFA